MDAIEKEETNTIDDIYNLPEGERAELINGTIYYMAPPGLTHQRISMFLSNEIAAYIKKNAGECEVLAAPFAVFLNDDDKTYLEPDIFVTCDRSKLDEKGCHGAPDWVVEIASLSSKPRDYIRKMFLYHAAGVREYWIVDPEKNMTSVYNFEKNQVEQYFFEEEVPVGIYKGFSISFGENNFLKKKS